MAMGRSDVDNDLIGKALMFRSAEIENNSHLECLSCLFQEASVWKVNPKTI